MAQIKDFDRVRVGNEWPVVVDVDKIGGHCAHGIISKFSCYDYPNEDYYMQVRKHNNDPVIFVVQYKYSDQEEDLLPYWQNSEVLFDSRGGNA